MRHHHCWGGEPAAEGIWVVGFKWLLDHTCVVVISYFENFTVETSSMITLFHLLSDWDHFLRLAVWIGGASGIRSTAESHSDWHAVWHKHWAARCDFGVCKDLAWLLKFIVVLNPGILIVMKDLVSTVVLSSLDLSNSLRLEVNASSRTFVVGR